MCPLSPQLLSVQELSRALTINTSLRYLSLSRGVLDQQCGGALGAGLEVNRSITELDLSLNPLLGMGLSAILQVEPRPWWGGWCCAAGGA